MARRFQSQSMARVSRRSRASDTVAPTYNEITDEESDDGQNEIRSRKRTRTSAVRKPAKKEKKQESDDESVEDDDDDYEETPPRTPKRSTNKSMPRSSKKSTSVDKIAPKKPKREKKSQRDTTRDQWIAARGGFDPVVRWGEREGSTMKPGKRRVSQLDAFQANAVLFELGEDPKATSGWQPKCEAIHDIVLANRDHPIIVKPKNKDDGDDDDDESQSPVRKQPRRSVGSKSAKIEKSDHEFAEDDKEDSVATPPRTKRAVAKTTPSARRKQVTPKEKSKYLASMDKERVKWAKKRGGYDPIVRWDTQPGSKIKPGQKKLSLLDNFQANNVLVEMGVDPHELKGWEAKLDAIRNKLLADRSHYDVVVHPDLSDESDEEHDAEDEYNAFLNGNDDEDDVNEEEVEDKDRRAYNAYLNASDDDEDEDKREYNAFLNADDDDDDDDEDKNDDDDDFDDPTSEEEDSDDYMYEPGKKKANMKPIKPKKMKEGYQILKRGPGRPPGTTDCSPRNAKGDKKPARDSMRNRWIVSMGGFDPIVRWGTREGSSMRRGRRRLSLLDAFQANAVLVEMGEDPKKYSGWQPKCEAIHKILLKNRDHPVIFKPRADSESSSDETDTE